MAGFIPSFLSGSKVAIRIGSKVIAYAQNVSISDDMSVTPVGTIGSYSMQALEPTNYIARGSMTITHYSNVVLAKLSQIGTTAAVPQNLREAAAAANTVGASPSAGDGNSLLIRDFFSPANLMISRTFDMDFYERLPEAFVNSPSDPGQLIINEFGSTANPRAPIYRLENARLTSYNIGFTPGSLVNETVSFIATGLIDSRAGELTKTTS